VAIQKEKSELMEVEINRKFIHALGVFSILLIQVFGKNPAAVIMLFATIFGFLIAEYRKNRKKYKIIKIKKLDAFEDFLEDGFKEIERPNSLIFKGAIEFGLGCTIATFAFSEKIAMACIAVLALADSLSTLVGYYFGKYKLPINKKKTWEGSITFFLVSFFILYLFTNPLYALILALITTVVEALPYFDDNLSIPIGLGIAMNLIV
jgi:dolichol kinase